MPRPIAHARDHYASGADPAATAWFDFPYDSPWTGTMRYRLDGDGDIELEGTATGGTLPDTLGFIPEAFWPARDSHRVVVTADDALVRVSIYAVDGEVTMSEITSGGGSVDAVDVTFTPTGGISATDLQAALAELDSEKQPLDATLTALAAANWASNALPIGTGSDTLSQTSFSANTFPARSSSGNLVAKAITDFALSVLDDSDAATARATLGVIASLFQSGGAQAIKLDDLATPDDNSDLNATTSAHGLLRKLDNDTDHFLRGDGSWATPGSSGTTEVWVPASDMWPSVTGGCSGPTQSEMTTNKQTITTMDFVDGADNKAEFCLQMPPTYAGGTVTFKVYWTAASTDTDNVVFGLEARAAGNDEAIDGSWGTQVVVQDAHTATAYKELITAESSAVTASNTPTAGDVVYFRLQRKASSSSPIDNLGQTAKVLGVLLDFAGDGTAAMPSFVAAGTAAETNTGAADLAVPFPAGLASGDMLFAQIVLRHGSDALDTVPGGWTLHKGPDAQSSTMQQWIYTKTATGSESGTETWSSPNTLLFFGRMYAFRDCDTTTISESGGKSGANDTAFAHSSATSTGPNRLAVCFGTVSDDNNIDAMTGATGFTWTQPVAEYTTTLGLDGCLDIQTAQMPVAATISGGGFTMAASDPWLTRTILLLPVGG